VTGDITIVMPYGDALTLRVYLERERLRQRKDGLSHRSVDRLIELVEAALFPNAERDYTADELLTIRRQSR
jgi:hypothetical protein